MNTLISNYKNALQAIYDHVGFKEDWAIYTIADHTDKYWHADDDSVCYADSESDFYYDHDEHCVEAIYKHRFYDKWVYEGAEFTMIFCDPQVDGMKWFKLFDNKKRLLPGGR